MKFESCVFILAQEERDVNHIYRKTPDGICRRELMQKGESNDGKAESLCWIISYLQGFVNDFFTWIKECITKRYIRADR